LGFKNHRKLRDPSNNYKGDIMAETLVPILGVITAILTLVTAVVNSQNKNLKRENNRLSQQYIDLRQDYSKNVGQLIQIKKGETKIELDSEQVLRKNFPTVFFYLFYLLYFISGYLIGRKFDIIEKVYILFRPTVQFKNPEFWIVIVIFIIMVFIPLYPRNRFIRKFPHKLIQLPKENSTKKEKQGKYEFEI
jgi:hypothetical protein